MTKQRVQLIAGSLALFALLTYTWVHTGGLLSRYVTPWVVGYLAALGIELSIVGLSVAIGESRRTKRNPVWFYFVLVSVVVVSALANVAEGFNTLMGEQLTVDNAGQLDLIQVVIGLAATGLISLIVLALAEIIGTDYKQYVKEAAKEQRKMTTEPVTDNDMTDNLMLARQVRMTKIDQRREQVAGLVNEGMADDDIAGLLGVSVRTIQRDKEQLNGQIVVR